MRLRRKISDYNLRHLSLGKLKNLDKDSAGAFRIEKISWEVSWSTNYYLAVIIRDYLRFFIKNSLTIGYCVIDDEFETILYYDGDDEFSEEQNAKAREKHEYYAKKWKDLVNSVADEFDELVKMMHKDSIEIDDYQEFNMKQKALEKKAFYDLSEIFNDLFW